MASAVHLLPPKYRLDRSNVTRGVATLMVLEAASLGIAAALHLSGLVHGRAASFDPDSAGIAESVIGVVLAVAAIVMFRTPVRARAVGIAATSFALAGFLVGISETARGGDIPDIAYHSVVIPLLIGGLVLLIGSGRPAPLPST